ncbi:MAG: DUF4160 domain-containing protein [Dysgonamonadaceae bacterium]|nr:DUF4160 domain-containing protein [Dysgonamonadaceae bacterium]
MRFYYWSREHEPIHVHVKKGDAGLNIGSCFSLNRMKNENCKKTLV